MTNAPELEHAARLMAKSLTDEMLFTLRIEWGNTNAAVLLHWRTEVLRLTDKGAQNG